MYKKTITYTDYNDVERTEDFYFNLTAEELTEMQVSVDGGYGKMIQDVVDAKDVKSMIRIMKDLITKSYGVKSEDGKRFKKKPEYLEEFMESPAFSAFYMELVTDEKAASEFVNKIIPSNLTNQVKIENKTVESLPSKT